MYEHPIKRFGLSMNRIVYANSKMVNAGFPVKKDSNRMGITFRMRTFSAGRATSNRVFHTEDLDELLPSSIKE